jgi:hypothetical protein
MKHLLTGAAIVAVTALAIPAFAQPALFATPRTSPQPAPMPPSTTTAKPIHHVAMRHHYRGVSEGGADQLNQQELQRIQSGAPPLTPVSMPAPMSPAPMPSNYQTPGRDDAATAPAPVPPSNYQTPGK